MKPRAAWNSIGSLYFAFTVLAVLGLGGGLVLALLPFNSVERSVAIPPLVPEAHYPATPRATPISVDIIDAETSEAFAVNTATTSASAGGEARVGRYQSERTAAFPEESSSPFVATGVSAGWELGAQTIHPSLEHLTAQVPLGKASASYEALQIASIPEPATSGFVGLGIVAVALVALKRRASSQK